MSVPLYIFTGFLGSGKTTLLSRLLLHDDGVRSAVLVNEIGEVPLDHHLVEQVDEEIAVLSSGCICCTIRGALAESLTRVLELAPDRVVLETTGLANPAPVLHALGAHPELSRRLRLGATVVAVDAHRGESVLDDHLEARAQLALADRVVLTKIDLAPRPRTEVLRARVRAEAPGAEVLEAAHGDVAPARLWSEAPAVGLSTAARAREWLDRHPHADHEVQATTIDLGGRVDAAALTLWLSLVTQLDGPRLLRVKGIVEDLEGQVLLLQSAEHAVTPPRRLEAPPKGWRGSRLVLVTRGLPEGPRTRLVEAAYQAAAGARRSG